MPQEWVQVLYPLGYLSSVLFGVRFLVQWLYSESKGKSVVPPLFWWLSLAGNFALLIHSMIQMQFHVALMQSLNGVVSWRNLDLSGKTPRSFTFTVILMGISSLTTSLYFILFSREWFAMPGGGVDLFFGWHLLGMLGIGLFASRFMLQWWLAEISQRSTLPLIFWWMSLSGALISILYFAKISDPVNLIGPLLGMIPYIRNLMLLYKKEPKTA